MNSDAVAPEFGQTLGFTTTFRGLRPGCSEDFSGHKAAENDFLYNVTVLFNY